MAVVEEEEGHWEREGVRRRKRQEAKVELLVV
jgi:hypothetical protein